MTNIFRVLLEDAALTDLLLPCIERACVNARKDDVSERESGDEQEDFEGREVSGYLWGFAQEQRPGKVFITISRASVAITPKASSGWVLLSPAANQIHSRIFKTVSPQFLELGHFHSHPYMHINSAAVMENDFDLPSAADKLTQKNHPNQFVNVIVTISRINFQKDFFPAWKMHGSEPDPACITFQLNDLAIWIRAIVREEGDDHTTLSGHKYRKSRSQVHLYCPRVQGMLSLFELHDDPDVSFQQYL